MVMDPPQLVIPPHEFRYTSVVFAPQAIQQYSGTLEAVVKDGSDPATQKFTCEIRGEGTLPSLALQVRGKAMGSGGWRQVKGGAERW